LNNKNLFFCRDANKKENENEVICEILNGIAECVEQFGETSIITAQDIEQIYELVLFRLEYLTKRRIEREADVFFIFYIILK